MNASGAMRGPSSVVRRRMKGYPCALDTGACRLVMRHGTSRKDNATMRLEASLHDVPWGEIPAHARAIEALGFDSIAQPELRRDPFLPLTLASTATARARLVTSVAIAFPRSPMANAYTAWNLQEM